MRSEGSEYHVLDLDASYRSRYEDEEGKQQQPALITKRKPLQEALKDDEDLFETSLASLSLYMEKKNMVS